MAISRGIQCSPAAEDERRTRHQREDRTDLPSAGNPLTSSRLQPRFSPAERKFVNHAVYKRMPAIVGHRRIVDTDVCNVDVNSSLAAAVGPEPQPLAIGVSGGHEKACGKFMVHLHLQRVIGGTESRILEIDIVRRSVGCEALQERAASLTRVRNGCRI